MTNANRSKHVLFVGASQKSHLIHMQGLAEEMMSRGYQVTLAALDSDKDIVTHVNFLSAGEPERDAAYYGHTHDIVDLFRLCADYSVHLYEKILPQVKDGDVDLVVFDHLFWPAGHALARDIGARSAMLYPGLFGLQHLGMEPDYAPMIISGFQSPVSKSLPHRLQNFVMLRVARYILQTVRYVIFRGATSKLNITEPNPYGKTKLALHGSFSGLGEVSRVQSDLAAPMVKSSGPWLPRSTNLSTDVQSFLKSGPPVVFFSIGTNADWTETIARVLVEVIQNFHKTKELRVLWSLKEKAFTKVVQPILESSSSSAQMLSDTLLIAPFVDQFAVLQSDSVVAFVSHCGFGSMQEAIHTGTPVLAMPMMLESDQITNAARLVQLGMAQSFDARPGQDEISTIAMLSKLRDLVKHSSRNNTYKQRANELSKISTLLQGPKRAADWLEIELEAGTEFMVNIENQLSLVETFSVDVYGVLLFVAIALYITCAKVFFRCCKRKTD